MDLSLFYFADESVAQSADRYHLLLEGARFADAHGFAAVWTPERHFHRFGGNYPNPAVTGAAVAAVTDRIAIRAGSVVAPLHRVEQIAEDWWTINSLSRGRAGVSLASGWNRGDFVLNPNGYDDRLRNTVEGVGTLRRIWGERQGEIPLWLSTGGSSETFITAGGLGLGVLTHLATQSPEDLAARVREYREAYESGGFPGSGHVALMLHAYVGENAAEVESLVRRPLENYLMSAMNLLRAENVDKDARQEKIARLAVQPAYEKYLRGGCGLIGTVDQVASVARDFRDLGVDEIACLIDFGVPPEAALAGLAGLDAVRAEVAAR
ncbi:MupA/Atu3671 family FMN-dependent luciferase-like monooxygenase [Kutzneria buriramensis]|uniref:MupA/Atu3671 family FMN-dependent luciferase-like monooxygenase n=1 Tax=Kutzneria buriramensis TaxID=1045776 RepID=UPI000E256DE8|nr:MupA/Atu3671 family FMN-dependent luciferase-like monooxygenase [Kutzneria buriramensis]